MSNKRKKWKIIIGVLIFALIAVRIYLPYYLKDTIESAVSEVEGYECKIKDLDLALYRGAVTMDSFQVFVTNNKVSTPFVLIGSTDGSIQWSELFKGRIVSELYLDELLLYLADDDSEDKKQMGGTDWTEPIKELINIDINRFGITNGTINFVNTSSKPKVDIAIKDITMDATNLSNTDGLDGKLPSDLFVKATMFESGSFNLKGKVNVLKEIPDMDLNFEILEVDLTQLNDFTNEYGKFDFERGEFANIGELAMYKGKITGYIEPFFTDVKVLDLKEESTGFLNKVWEGVVGFLLEITENQKKDQTATRVPISGQVDNVKVNTLETILNVLRNAFIESFQLKLEDEIDFSDVKNNGE